MGFRFLFLTRCVLHGVKNGIMETPVIAMVRVLDSVRKALSWGRHKPNIAEVKSDLRVMAKQLERQRNKLEIEERKTKSRAITARKEGRTQAYRTYTKEMVRFRKYVLSVEKSRLQMLRLLAHLTRAQTNAKANHALADVSKVLEILGEESDVSEVIEHTDEISRRIEEYEIETQISEDALGYSVDGSESSDELTAAFEEIDRAAGMEETRTATREVTEIDKLERAIQSLENELGI